MIGNKKVLAVIPARGGSKGLPNKNLQQLGGKPLLVWTIEAANQSKYIDRLILSSEDPTIIATAKAHHCEVPFIRPRELAADETSGVAPILHALQQLPNYDYVVVLQVTSPLRSAVDIDGAIAHCENEQAPACVSVVAVKKNPYWMYTLSDNRRLVPLLGGKQYLRRQELPAVYCLNGAVYVARSEFLQQQQTFLTSETVAFPMPEERSVDIDRALDLSLAEQLIYA